MVYNSYTQNILKYEFSYELGCKQFLKNQLEQVSYYHLCLHHFYAYSAELTGYVCTKGLLLN